MAQTQQASISTVTQNKLLPDILCRHKAAFVNYTTTSMSCKLCLFKVVTLQKLALISDKSFMQILQ